MYSRAYHKAIIVQRKVQQGGVILLIFESTEMSNKRTLRNGKTAAENTTPLMNSELPQNAPQRHICINVFIAI